MLSVSRHGVVIGLFVFLVLPEEKYLEMIVGLSREDGAYREILDFLKACYPAWKADFVFNPGNDLLKGMLLRAGADFCPEQQKMVLSAYRPPVDTDGIVPLSERY